LASDFSNCLSFLTHVHLVFHICHVSLRLQSLIYYIVFLQDRLKKRKSEHGKVQLGNITVNMVCNCQTKSMDTSVSFVGPTRTNLTAQFPE
jgi:hypothetical protein